jgi:hypothetical protein
MLAVNFVSTLSTSFAANFRTVTDSPAGLI